MSNSKGTLAVIAGAALVAMVWASPFRQAASAFNQCVETLTENRIRLDKRLTPAVHQMRAVSVCNGSSL